MDILLNSIQAWRNFSMGNELQVAGNFIYDGLRNLDEMHTLDNTTDIFNFMYLISVGIERLQKVCIVLCVPDNDTDFDMLVSEIKHHNHVSLMDTISKSKNIKFLENENILINLLSKFYNELRYGRYSLDRIRLEDEKKEFLAFLKNKLKIEESYFGVPNDDRIKGFIGRIVGGISNKLYELIEDEGRRLGLYTYEVNGNSKAYKIFIEKNYDFSMERRALRELIVYLLNGNALKDLKNAIENMEPLDLDIHSLKSIETFIERRELTETVEELYSYFTNQERKKRQQIIDILTEEGIDWELVRKHLLEGT